MRTKTIVVRALATDKSDTLSGAASCLFLGIPIDVYKPQGFLFLSDIVEVNEFITYSDFLGWDRRSDADAEYEGSYAHKAATEKPFTPLSLLGKYLLKSHGHNLPFSVNETSTTSSEPHAFFCSHGDIESINKLKKLYPQYSHLPSLNYNQSDGSFLKYDEKNNKWENYTFLGHDVFSRFNENHIKLANEAYESFVKEAEMDRVREIESRRHKQEPSAITTKASGSELKDDSKGWNRGNYFD